MPPATRKAASAVVLAVLLAAPAAEADPLEDGRGVVPAGDGADDRRDRPQGRVRARRDRARRGRARAPRSARAARPTGATPRSAPAMSRPPPSPTAARSRSTAATPAPATTSTWLRSRQPDAFQPAAAGRRDRHAAVLPHLAARPEAARRGRRVRDRDPAARAVGRSPPARAHRGRHAAAGGLDRDARVRGARGSPRATTRS